MMSMPRQSKKKLDYEGEINPDGLEIRVIWEHLAVGASVFIPAVNLVKLDRQVCKAATARNMRLAKAERIENGKLGLRYWRVL